MDTHCPFCDTEERIADALDTEVGWFEADGMPQAARYFANAVENAMRAARKSLTSVEDTKQ